MPRFSLIGVFKLLRPINLVVVALTQGLIYYRIILPAFQLEGLTGALTPRRFSVLCLVTLIVTASGYIVNDLRDVRIDAINKPGKNQIERLGIGNIQWLYAALILLGFLFSLELAMRMDERPLLFIYPMAVGALALYSVRLKQLPLVGNLLVASFCAGVPALLVLAERSTLRRLLEVNPGLGYDVLRICVLFMVFAFIATLLRELVKDMEDLKGDATEGRRTLPVLLGVTTSRRLALLLGGLVILFMLIPVLLGWTTFLAPPILTCMGLLLLLVIAILIQLMRARQPNDFHRLSTQLKFLLLGGLGLLIFF